MRNNYITRSQIISQKVTSEIKDRENDADDVAMCELAMDGPMDTDDMYTSEKCEP